MEDQKRTEISELGEFGLINHLCKPFKSANKTTIKAVGDDAAILSSGGNYMAVSTDLLIEGIHFDLMYSPLKHLGYKSVIINLSDICAMNIIPEQITVSIGISNRFSVEALEEIYAGIKKACDMYKVDLVGGDTTSSHKGLIISVTAIGQTAHKNRITYRSGANIGDIICVTGDLGAAYLGLQLLEREKQLFLSDDSIKPELGGAQYLLERQLKPEACTSAVRYLEKVDLIPTSMIDISDGLSSDLFHICQESGVGAYIEEGKVPLHPETEQMALTFNLDPISCALNGGEDYELLFTVAPQDLEKIRFMPGAYIIGEITDRNDGIKLHTTGGNVHDLKAQGWTHFTPGN